jgi:acetyl-CoA synthase
MTNHTKATAKKQLKRDCSVDKAVNDLNAYACECGMDTTFSRVANMEPQCGFGELGLCCRICIQGPCRINPFGDEPKEGICGARDYTIVARNIIRMAAAGAAAHSDHGRHIVHTLHSVAEGKTTAYSIKDSKKLHKIAGKLGLKLEGRSDKELALEVSELAYHDFSSQGDEVTAFLKALIPPKRLMLFDTHDVLPTNIDRGITEVMHRTTMGCDADPVPLIFGGIKCALGDLTGEHISTSISDILFGTPRIVKAEANLNILMQDAVNIVVHGHNPILSEVIVDVANELEGEAKAAGAKGGISISGICCTANELLMRHGIPIATNFLGQDLALMTGVVDAMVVDYQCIMPALAPIANCFHTKLISTMPITRIPGDIHIEFNEKTARENARQIVRLAIDAYKHRDPNKIRIPEMKSNVVAGFSFEAIEELLAKVGPKDPLGYLVDKLKDGSVQGIALMAGCNNQKLLHDDCHLKVALELAKNDILVLATGCAAQAYAKAGLLSPESAEKYAGESLKKVLKELGEAAGLKSLPLVLHMGSCVDNSRPQELVSALAEKLNVDIGQLPIVASAPEAMSEKAVAIGTWAIALGWPTHVGVYPYIKGSKLVNEVAEKTARDVYGGFFIFEPDPESAGKKLVNIVKHRRWKMGLGPEPVGIDGYGQEAGKEKKVTQRELYKMAIDGAIIATGYADILLNRAITKYGSDHEVAYPGTGYGLPCIDAWSGVEVKKLGDLPALLGAVRGRIKEQYTYENAFAAGEAVLYSAEIVEALKYLEPGDPYEGKRPYTGFVGDPILRKLGIAFVDDTIPAAAVFVGKAKDPKALVKLVRECQEKGMLIIVTFDIIQQLQEGGYRFDEGNHYGLDVMLYPVGEFTQAIHGASFATRAALAFAGIKRGDRKALYEYLHKRPRVFVVQLGALDDIKVAAEFGVLFMGSPTITDQDIEEIPDRYVMEKDYTKILQRATELRDIKYKMTKVPIPVLYGPSFEGESIRKQDMFIEAGGTRTPALEYVRMANADDVVDGKTTFIGKDVDQLEEGKAIPLGIFVDVYGRKMQKDFESVLERRIHQFVNFIEGGWHTGQRNLIWVRLSKNSVKQGLKLKDLGTVLHAKFHADFAGIVDRVQVTITTEEAELKRRAPAALEAYEARDARIRGLTDEAVDTFYSCTLCQSFAPNHLCVISPERLGLCGAINWLDAKASFEIAPTGPNRPWKKGLTVEPVKGQWEGINAGIKELSRGKIERFNAYSLMEDPMTSCGCFECILALVPEANGILVVNREYSGETPIGMKFSTLAGQVGGGNQVPGFLGVGRQYITSKKFISADGGFPRLVWMPKMLKDALHDRLVERGKEIGDPDFINKIADETVATSADKLLEFMQKVNHPALKLDPMI